MVCGYKFFTGDRLWRTHTGEIAPLWWTTLIFTHNYEHFFIPPVVVHQRTHYTQDLHYNIPSDQVIHNSLSGYMDCDGWHKSMSNFPSNCCYFPLNPQILFYDVHDIHLDDRSLDILIKHKIQLFILKAGDYVHDHPNDKIPNMKLNNLHSNERMKWTRQHVTLKSKPDHMNSVLVATWESFKLSSAAIAQNASKKTHIPPL